LIPNLIQKDSTSILFGFNLYLILCFHFDFPNRLVGFLNLIGLLPVDSCYSRLIKSSQKRQLVLQAQLHDCPPHPPYLIQT